MRRRPAIAAATALALTVSAAAGGCSNDGERTLTVFAASSLTAAFTQIGADFEAANPGTAVVFNFGPSDGLAAQIEAEGGADVYASASQSWMDEVAERVGVAGRVDFARNRLLVITPVDDPAGVASLQDLTEAGVQVVLAAEGVPVGDYAREVLANAGMLHSAMANVVSNEIDDASVVAKVASGEADAGIVYASDLHPEVRDRLRAVEIPGEVNVVATYPIAVVEGASESGLGADFVAFVLSAEGRSVLDEFGFLAP